MSKEERKSVQPQRINQDQGLSFNSFNTFADYFKDPALATGKYVGDHHAPRHQVRYQLREMVGLKHSHHQKACKVPSGWEVKHDKKGYAYLKYVGDIEDSEAFLEHRKNKLPMKCSRAQLRDRYGTGIYLYFDFVKFLTWTNVVLFLLSMASFVPHIYYTRNDIAFENVSSRAVLYLASYTQEVRTQWWYTTIISGALMFLFGPLYSNKINRYFNSVGTEDFEDAYDSDADIIPDNEHLSKKSRAIRLAFSYIMITILLLISASCTFIIILLEDSLTGLQTAVALACFLKVVHWIWKKICMRLSVFERHSNWSTHRTHNTLKLYLFKMLNVILMYFTRWLVRKENITFFGATGSSVESFCSLITVADQFAVIVLLDVTLQNMWEIAWPIVATRIFAKRGRQNEHSNEASKPEFEIADEYLEVLYRQFIIYLGTPYFPLLPLLGILANIIEFWLDKYRLLRIAQEPHLLQGSMKKFLVIYLFINALLAACSYPFGIAWLLLSDYAQGDSDIVCTFNSIGL